MSVPTWTQTFIGSVILNFFGATLFVLVGVDDRTDSRAVASYLLVLPGIWLAVTAWGAHRERQTNLDDLHKCLPSLASRIREDLLAIKAELTSVRAGIHPGTQWDAPVSPLTGPQKSLLRRFDRPLLRSVTSLYANAHRASKLPQSSRALNRLEKNIAEVETKLSSYRN